MTPSLRELHFFGLDNRKLTEALPAVCHQLKVVLRRAEPASSHQRAARHEARDNTHDTEQPNWIEGKRSSQTRVLKQEGGITTLFLEILKWP